MIGRVIGSRGFASAGASSAMSSLRESRAMREPGEADRPARHAPRRDVERPMGERDRIGAGAPVGADRERDDIVARRRDRRRRSARSCRRSARPSPCRRRPNGCAASLLRPARSSSCRASRRRCRACRRWPCPTSRRRSVKLVSSPSSVLTSSRCAPQPTGAENLAGSIGADVDRSARDALRRLDRLEAPAAVGVEPLIVVGHLVERPFGALARDARAVGRDRDRLEGRDVAGADRRRRSPS